MRPLFPPYYHPTTVCFVDDNYAFMRSVAAIAPRSWSFISFTSPEQALEAINKPDELEPLADRCFSLDYANPLRPTVHLHVSALEQEIKWVQRFSRISAVLIDYAMPTMSGLEFCEQIVDKKIRRGLLTGVADEKTAVAAFNKGLIHRYIPKQADTNLEFLIPHVERMKHDYFNQFTASISNSLAMLPPQFMAEPDLVPYFERILTKYRIVEYYLSLDPSGYLMLQSDGTALRLVVFSEEELAEQRAIAARYNAPARLQRRLAKGKIMLYLYEHPRDYMGAEPYPWEEMQVPARRVEACQTWYIGVAKNPPADIDFDPASCSYDHFLTFEQPRV